MGLSVTILGCSARTPGRVARAAATSSAAAARACGSTPGRARSANLQQHIDLADLDAIVVSHSHPDHWVELGVLRNALKYGFQAEGLPVYSTRPVRELIDIVCGDSSEPTFGWETSPTSTA